MERRVPDCVEFEECWSVVDATVEVPIRDVLDKEVRLVWVPPDVLPEDVEAYVDANIGKKEYVDSDDDSDDSMSDFIVEGEEWGWYQLAVDPDSDAVRCAPSPQFVDLWMSFDPEHGWQSEFLTHVTKEFWAPAVRTHDQRLDPPTALVEALAGSTSTLPPAFGAFLRAMDAYVGDHRNTKTSAVYETCLRFREDATFPSVKN